MVKNDLVLEKVCAIVNPANSMLTNGKGAALAIRKAAGGDSFQNECMNLLSDQGPIPVGGVGVTSAGDMTNIRFVIHAVGPIYKNYD